MLAIIAVIDSDTLLAQKVSFKYFIGFFNFRLNINQVYKSIAV